MAHPGVAMAACIGVFHPKRDERPLLVVMKRPGAPVMLFALLLGMAMNFLSGEGKCAPGIAFTARELLRVGVALLGLRITAAQVAALGWHPVLLVVASVNITIGVSMLAASAGLDGRPHSHRHRDALNWLKSRPSMPMGTGRLRQRLAHLDVEAGSPHHYP